MVTSRIWRALVLVLPLVVIATSLRAQEVRTVRELTEVPEDALAAIQAMGADLSQAFMDSALTAHLDTETEFTVRAVVLTDPLNSGLATWDDDRGGPGRVHIWVRDTAAATQGNANMSFQIVDGAYEDNATLDIIPGDVIEMTGVLGFFTNSVQFSPNAIVVLGSYTDLGLPESILAHDTVATSDLNMSVGAGVYQANWANYNNVTNGFVCITDATLFQRAVTGSREDWSITTDGGESIALTYDMSLRYRNDRDGSYTAPFNVLEENFVPPPVGATVDVCGSVLHQPGNDPFVQTQPEDAMLSLAPWSDADLTIKASPPRFTAPLSRPEALIGSGEEFNVVADIVFDPEREPVGVTLNYYTVSGAGEEPADTMEVAMVNPEGTIWEAAIPGPGVDRTFVVYWAEAEDNTGAVSNSSPENYRVFDGAVVSISDLQEAALAGPNDDWPSPLEGLNLAFDLPVTVQSQPGISEFVSVQDDADLGPWSGIILDMSPDGLNAGDELVIATATIEEVFGVTQLTDIVLGEASGKTADRLPYKDLSTADLADPLGAEQHEGMLVNFDNITIVDELSFGEWSFTNGTEDEAVLGDGASASFPDDNSRFEPGEQYEFLRGIWWFSFGTYKLVPEDENDVGPQEGVAIERIGEVPGEFALKQNYPNPFNPTTMISYDIPQTGRVTLEVFDVTGKKIATLVNQELSAGSYQVSFDAGDLASGLYLYRLAAGEQVQTNKMLLMR